MTFVCANLHGELGHFKAMLEAIRFSDRDLLYVLGDSVDFGEDAMALLVDMSMRPNVYALAGERDFRALRLLTGFETMLREGTSPDADFSAEMNAWVADGGMPTLTGYRALDAEMREGVLDYLADCMLCDTVQARGKTFVLAHAGLGNYAPDKAPEDYLPEEVFTPALPDADFFARNVLVVGHAPTESGRIEHRDGVIYLDCGAGRGGRLGCLCLETGEEFYA